MLTFDARFEAEDELNIKFDTTDPLKVELSGEEKMNVSIENLIVMQTGGSGILTPATKTRLGGIIVGNNLSVTENGTLSVDMAEEIEKDNTRPISSAQVYTSIGNINALLNEI